MKKLMIAAAIVCAAAFAQAANCNWSTYAYDATETTALAGGSYWFFSLGTDTSAFANIKVKEDGTLTGWSGATKQDITDPDFGLISDTITGLSESDNGTYYAIVVVDADNEYYGKAYGQVTGIVADPPTDAESILFDNGTTGSWGGTLADTKTVKEEPTPEPTSGLLMLLGMAGLALRRKQK